MSPADLAPLHEEVEMQTQEMMSRTLRASSTAAANTSAKRLPTFGRRHIAGHSGLSAAALADTLTSRSQGTLLSAIVMVL